MPVPQRHNRTEFYFVRFFYAHTRAVVPHSTNYGRTTTIPERTERQCRTNTKRTMAENLRLNEGFNRAKRGAYNRVRNERIARTTPELYPRWRAITRKGNVREYHELSNRIIRASYQVWHIQTNVQFK